MVDKANDTSGYPRLARPAYTQVPNVLIDYYFPLMSDTECRVIVVLVRETFGWGRSTTGPLSGQAIADLSQRSRQAVVRALEGLECHWELIERVPSGNTYRYRMRFWDQEPQIPVAPQRGKVGRRRKRDPELDAHADAYCETFDIRDKAASRTRGLVWGHAQKCKRAGVTVEEWHEWVKRKKRERMSDGVPAWGNLVKTHNATEVFLLERSARQSPSSTGARAEYDEARLAALGEGIDLADFPTYEEWLSAR